MKNRKIETNYVSNHFEIELESNNRLLCNNSNDEGKHILIIKNNDANYLVNKESRVAPVCSSNYPSGRLYEYQDNMSSSYKSHNIDSVCNKDYHQINQKSNVKLGSSNYNFNLNVNDKSNKKDSNFIKNDFEEFCIVGSGNIKINSSISNENKPNSFLNHDYNITEENQGENNNTINYSINPYKRSKSYESAENDGDVNNSFNSNKSKMEENSNAYKNQQSNINMTMKKSYNKTNDDYNENSVNISNHTDWKSKSGIGTIDNSCFKKSNCGNIFNYNDFFDKMKKKSEHRREITKNISVKTNENVYTNLKQSSDMIIEKLNQNIKRSYFFSSI